MANTISLDRFHDLLGESYAVSLNDTLYFVGYDEEGNPYVSDNDGGDYIDLSTVDGDIHLDESGVHFYIQEQPIRVQFLTVKTFSMDFCADSFFSDANSSYISTGISDPKPMRYGQFLMNTLKKKHPQISVPEEADCFYDNKKVSKFLEYLYSL